MPHTDSVSPRRRSLHPHTAPPGSAGHRILRARELAGLSRRRLAVRARLDSGLLAQVEHGDTPASPALAAAAARALHLDVAALYGQPYGPALCAPNADHAGIPTLRVALDSDDHPQPGGTVLSAPELRARLDECEQHRGAARYAELTAALPGLLHHGYALAAHAQPGEAAQTAAALLTDAYLLAHTASYRFGYLDLAALCAYLARRAAEYTADPLRVAVTRSAHTRLRLHYGDYPGVLRVLGRAHTALAEADSPDADAVRVQLHLRQVIAHTRSGNPEQAHAHLDTARELVGHGIPPSPCYTVSATPATIDVHWVAIPAELHDAATALHRADQIKIPTGEPAALLARHHLDLARARALHGDHDQALTALRHARTIAPQLVRYHPQARETLLFLAETQRRNPDTVPGFARWAGAEPSLDTP